MSRILPVLVCFAIGCASAVQMAKADGLTSMDSRGSGGMNSSRFLAFDEGGYDKSGQGYGSCQGTSQRYGETYGRYNEPLGAASSTSAFGRYGGSGDQLHQRYGSYYGRCNEPLGQSGASTFGGWGSGNSGTAGGGTGSRMLGMYMMHRAMEARENGGGAYGNQGNVESLSAGPTHMSIQTPTGTQTYNTTASTEAAQQLGAEVSNDFSAILRGARNSIQNGGMRYLNGNNVPSPYAGTRYVAPVGADPLPYRSQGLIPEFTTYANREQGGQ